MYCAKSGDSLRGKFEIFANRTTKVTKTPFHSGDSQSFYGSQRLIDTNEHLFLLALSRGWNGRLWYEYGSRTRRRSVAGSIRGDDLERVFSRHTVSGDRTNGTKADILKDSVDVSIVTMLAWTSLSRQDGLIRGSYRRPTMNLINP